MTYLVHCTIMSNVNIEYLENPDKSENDKKEYKILRLPNGLTALLVCDPSPIPDDDSETDADDSLSEADEQSDGKSEDDECCSTETENSDSSSEEDDKGDEKLAACGLMIDVGSFSDPRDIQGLSHFLEHMIFKGSEKYPQENAFDSHIKKCGGFDNATTEYEETLFYFQVADEHLESSIDRFISLFKDPLMKKEGMTRERDAVESEFQSTLQEDENRRDQILAELANQSHPCSTFSWGNSITLKDNIDDDNLHKRLKEFQQRHYSANRMYCAIQARLPMSELERIVVKHFSDIPNNELPGNDFSSYNNTNAFSDEFYNNVIFVKPVSKTYKLELTWCLPSLVNEYRCKPHFYISYLLAYEGTGSLCAFLRKRLWALELSAGVDESGFEYNSMYSLYNICIYLTEDGFDNLTDVLSATYSYIKFFAQSGPNKRVFDELQDIEATTFRFQNERSAYDNVQDYITNLKYFPSKDILTGPELYYEYDEESIWKIINYLNNEKFNIMVTSVKKYNGVIYDRKEKWFGTEYGSIKMPEEWKDLWKNTKILSDFIFPEPNNYIANDFRIWYKENDENNFLSMPYPRKIMDSDVCELWYRQDDKFLLPEAYMYFYFITPLPLENVKNAVLLTLYSHLVNYHLVEQLYPAIIAGLYHQFYSSDKGLVLKVNGYNEKLHLIVDVITKSMTTIHEKITPEEFKVFVKLQQENYNNSLIKPQYLTKDIRLGILENIRWPMYGKYNQLTSITLDNLKNFSIDLLKQMRIQAVIQGNVTQETAHNVMNSILTNFNCTGIKNKELIQSRTRRLPIGSKYILAKSLNQNDVNTVVCNFYQIGPCTLRTDCLLDLLLMIVEEPLFDILRTKEQLGYDVSLSVRNNFGILAYSITVNSQENKFTSSHIDDRIEAFRTEMMNVLQNMDEDEFNDYKEGLIITKQVADNELKDEISRNWSEITCNEYIFDRPKREIDCIKSIKKSDVVAFFAETEKNNFRKLSVQVIGNAKNIKSKNLNVSPQITDPPQFTDDQDDAALKKIIKLELLKGNSSTISDIMKFKNSLYVYPVTKTLLDFPPSSNLNLREIMEEKEIN